ncbi:hypothetical protein L21SP2_3007 [Salinispira pacifica]|uniref:Uncharacterized protein n=1 Tax=Salinispira pacifica TaxID=1307761 RepID=V5WMG8_9SPIO|nr:hypothetical protein L21SP2_3007 [Salinispira pacifica]
MYGERESLFPLPMKRLSIILAGRKSLFLLQFNIQSTINLNICQEMAIQNNARWITQTYTRE